MIMKHISMKLLWCAGALALICAMPATSAAQSSVPVCRQRLVTVEVPRLSYAQIDYKPFEQQVYVYVPQIKSGPFSVWIVEGIYGAPFLRSSGALDEAGFQKLRASTNVRATQVSVTRGNGTDMGRFVFGRIVYPVQVLEVNSQRTTVKLAVCR
jgi:hypothetical protein